MADTMTAAEYQEMINGGNKDIKNNKFKNSPQKTDDGYFASKKELNQWEILKLQRKAGLITGLMKQVTFDLAGVEYRADFVYFDVQDKEWVVEDCKGFKTPEYKNKKKLMLNLLNIKIKES